ncbi:MAG: 4Fe-4S dicluster domain-containing protein, partial [Candidatus Caldarchaeum sp.]
PSYGFVIDQTRCIGCHACTVACKMENHVALGVFRTWVKYIERGAFPNARRFYTVLRCNHCDDAPCVKICPTSALFKRRDGIVDFDDSRCIGCKACMQACPYDALYIDPEENTAAKCHFCAHRIEQGLEPACVIVCPTGAILWGDLEDPLSKVSRAMRDNPVMVRKPEQKTKPKLYYIGADQHALTPTSLTKHSFYMWSDRSADGGDSSSPSSGGSRVVYDVEHPKPWKLKISTYVFTKAVAAGLMMMLAILSLFLSTPPNLFTNVIPSVSLLFQAVTGFLLVADLKKPTRFHYIFLKPNFSSWLAKGAFVLGVFGLVTVIWMFSQNIVLSILTIPLAALAAGYSSFLFNQCEGRDFWQSPSSLLHFVFSAIQAGSAATILIAFAGQLGVLGISLLGVSLALSNIVLTLVLLADVFMHHATAEGEVAAYYLSRGGGAPLFWTSITAFIISTIAAVTYVLRTDSILGFLASLTALAGLFIYETVWVKAGQVAPLS